MNIRKNIDYSENVCRARYADGKGTASDGTVLRDR